MALAISDELLATFIPIVVYWIYSAFYMSFGSFDNYRLHSNKDEEEKNLVSKANVIKNVLFQQTIQSTLAIVLYRVIGNEGGGASKSQSNSITVMAGQFIIAMFVLDTWQYFMHRYFHHNRFLYRHFHSHHHKLVVPYAFGAIYNHPLEAFVFDIIGGALSYSVSGMSPRTSMYFFSFATIKSVDDHCGVWLPGNLFHTSLTTIRLTMMFIIIYMEANIISLNHSSSCGIELWEHTCLILLKREPKEVLKLDLLKEQNDDIHLLVM